MLEFRRVFTLLLTLIFVSFPLLSCTSLTVQGNEQDFYNDSIYEHRTLYLENGSIIEVYIPKSCAESVSAEEIQGIIEGHRLDDDCCITFYDTSVDQSLTGGYITYDLFQPSPHYIYDTELTALTDPCVIKTEFVISVAKGQTITLAEEYQGGLSLEIKTGTPFVEALIGGGITCTYKKTQQFTGPPEGSQYNSRSYYVRYLGQENEWVQRRYYYGLLMGVASGTAIIPTEYQAYSIDRIVS